MTKKKIIDALIDKRVLLPVPASGKRPRDKDNQDNGGSSKKSQRAKDKELRDKIAGDDSDDDNDIADGDESDPGNSFKAEVKKVHYVLDNKGYYTRKLRNKLPMRLLTKNTWNSAGWWRETLFNLKRLLYRVGSRSISPRRY